jgi:translation initiation factor 2 subunit 1
LQNQQVEKVKLEQEFSKCSPKMLYKKEGFPETGDIVLCTVKRILHNSVFVGLDEYDNKEGIIHISEISPGRIRTIREFVKEGKKIVCKILRINEAHGNIELSLRRVNMALRIKKNEEVKLEQKAEKILEAVAKNLKTSLEEIYKKSGSLIIKEYGSLNACFQEVVMEGEKVLTKINIDKKVASQLAEIIKQRIKPPEIKVSQIVTVKNSLPNGIEEIKKAFIKTEEHAIKRGYDTSIIYLGSPRFRITIKAPDYKKANTEMEDVIKTLTTSVEKSNGIVETIKEK